MPLKRIALIALFALAAPLVFADPLPCEVSGLKTVSGLTASVVDNTLVATWDGDNQQLRLRFILDKATPVVKDLSVRRGSGPWTILLHDTKPWFSISSGIRRMSNQQMEPLEGLGIKLTPELRDKYKWDAFWDAPLDVPGIPAGGRTMSRNPPPDLPRSAAEVHRGTAVYKVTGCSVKTNGARLEISFPGVELGVFSGRLQYTVYKGANLIRQEIVAKTTEPSVAYKYDSGLAGVSIEPGSRMAWRDLSSTWQSNQFGGYKNDKPVPLKASNRLLLLEQGSKGSIAAFPPPHVFFWAREEETNLGYNWYQKNTDGTVSFGIRQPEKEESVQYQANFALYSAPAGSEQHMATYFYAGADNAEATARGVMAFTHGDHYKPLPGYQVMAHHYHMDLGERLEDAGSLDASIPDLDVIKSTGINIASEISSVFVGTGARPRRDPLKLIADSVEGARRHSDKDFLVMANQEVYGSPLGGHTDLLFSHPVYWKEKAAGEPLVDNDSRYGKVYHIGSADDFIEMARREDVLISMPHPRTKGSTGYPDAVKDKDFFADPHYHGVGFRWGMGLDLSEQRLCGRRCLDLLDDMSNWMVDKPIPLKRLIAITETRFKAPGDDIYAASPVNYVKLDKLPSLDDVSPVVKALMDGDSFVTSGEVLIQQYSVQGTGDKRTIIADVEWTFPLEFVEVVWGDGKTTNRQIIPATNLPPFGKNHFQLPFNAAGQKWVRFAAWDSAGNGAVVQPVKLQ